MSELSYKDQIRAELSDKEKIKLDIILDKYKYITEKLDQLKPITKRQTDWINNRPHSVNKWLDIDLIEDNIVFIDYRGAK